MKVSIDTDIAIEILRARNLPILSQWTDLGNAGTMVLYSPIVAAEVWAGAFPREHSLISTFFRPLYCVPADHETGKLAGEFIRTYGKSHSLELGDAMIAAATVHHRAVLWTRNRKHYPMPQLAFL